MAISKIILNGVTQMDVTGKTVTAGDMLNGVTALKNDGTDITGSISAMTLPSASSATSSGTAKATITPTSSAQYLNIPTGFLDTAQYYTIAAASGGASNVVTGTFTGTTTGTSMDVTLNYSGSGYPIVLLIYPTGGTYNSNTTYYSLIQRYAANFFLAIKGNQNSTPTYEGAMGTGSSDQATIYQYRKNSTSSATTYTGTVSAESIIYKDSNASSGNGGTIVKIRSKTKMAVYIADTSYGFAANIEYKYWVIYSS